MFADRIFEFGMRFKGRLNADLLQGALDYVGYNEESLAFEVLCDYIWECDVPITSEEYNEAVLLILDIGLDLGESPFNNLIELKK